MIAFATLPYIASKSSRSSNNIIISVSGFKMAANNSFDTIAKIADTLPSSSPFETTSTALAASPFSTWATSIASNKVWVGSAWMISSALLTTYSTTKFLKYQDIIQDDTLHTSNRDKATTILDMSTNNKPSRKLKPQTKMSRASMLTLYRFSGSLLLGLLIHKHFYQIKLILPRLFKTIQTSQLFLLPSLFLFIANFSNSIALDRIGISLTYTSKCGIPLITVLFTLLLDGLVALPSNATLLSLLPIAAGIGMASWNTPTFELYGFLAAIISTTSQAALNVVSKRVMKRTGIKGVEAQRSMVLVALCIGLSMTVMNSIGSWISEVREMISNPTSTVQEWEKTQEEEQSLLPSSIQQSHPPIWLTSLAILAYHMEYVLSFSFVSLVEPITYGTCDALRRLLIIITGRQLFGGDKFSKTNIGGICMALVGALMYSITSARGSAVKVG